MCRFEIEVERRVPAPLVRLRRRRDAPAHLSSQYLEIFFLKLALMGIRPWALDWPFDNQPD